VGIIRGDDSPLINKDKEILIYVSYFRRIY